MSTRANVIIVEHGSYIDYLQKDENGKNIEVEYQHKLYFYRHSDGYPTGTLPTLNKFMELVKDGKIRDNVSQAAGWLVIIGAIEYQTVSPELFRDHLKNHRMQEGDELVELLNMDNNGSDWKVGAYEPATGIHGDIEHLYIVDLTDKKVYEEPRENWDKWN